MAQWPLIGGLLGPTFSIARRGLGGAAARPGGPLLTVAAPNVTAHPSTASVRNTVLLYNGPLLCGFNNIIYNNIQDNVYGAVIMAEPLREFTRFI